MTERDACDGACRGVTERDACDGACRGVTDRAACFGARRGVTERVAREARARLPEDGPARRAIEVNGGIVVTASLDEAIALSEAIAPEHVVCGTDRVAARLTRVGTIFVGAWSAQNQRRDSGPVRVS